ncbi:hypothetical protein AGMMS50293_29980 [Spirochaetia bacterium]|nr:hypothetical protein AGMMS50293_29980 [Spirochaetia bacterium]
MLTCKRLSVLVVAALVAVSAAVGQNSNSNNNREMSVEESYLQESIELMVIRETSRADSRDQKMVALEYIGEAIDRGNTSDDIRQALEYLAMEGVMNKARENGRLVNNFPDVRRQAAKYLGSLGTEEAKNTLIKICAADNEPMVLQEAVKSLGDIGLNDNDETVNAIAWIVTRFDVLNPDNLLALSAVDAFSKIAEKNNGIKDPNAVRLLIRISEGPYIRPVQERAKQVLMDLRKYSAQNKDRDQQNQQRNQ